MWLSCAIIHSPLLGLSPVYPLPRLCICVCSVIAFLGRELNIIILNIRYLLSSGALSYLKKEHTISTLAPLPILYKNIKPYSRKPMNYLIKLWNVIWHFMINSLSSAFTCCRIFTSTFVASIILCFANLYYYWEIKLKCIIILKYISIELFYDIL